MAKLNLRSKQAKMGFSILFSNGKVFISSKRNLKVCISTWLMVLYGQVIFSQGIDISKENAWYWEYQGAPVMLIGGSDNDNLFQSPDFLEQLDLLATIGGNYVRCTMSSRDKGDVWPFLKSTDGKYDLNSWNPVYWNRFHNFLDAAESRSIIVQVEIWATFDFYRENWEVNPFNPVNNRNLSPQRTKLPAKVETHPIYRDNPFFWSVPEMDNNTQLLIYQQKFVDKLLEECFRHDNVLYCIDNETSVSASWALFWAKYIQAKAKLAGKKVHATEMWDPWDLHHPSHMVNIFHDDVFSFIDISQNNHQKGQKHYDNGLAYKHKVKILSGKKPLTTVKTYGKLRHGNSRNGQERFWRSAFMGLSSVRFHRPDSGHGLQDTAQMHIKSLRMLFDAIDFTEHKPAPGLLTDVGPNEAYLLANPNKAYALYFPMGGKVKVKIEGEKTLQILWLDILSSEWQKPDYISSIDQLDLESPDLLRPWAVLVNIDSP